MAGLVPAIDVFASEKKFAHARPNAGHHEQEKQT